MTVLPSVAVMGAWGKDQKSDGKVRMLADGNGDFTKAMGLEMDGSRFGMGKRSQRYAMVVDNGVIKELNVEEPGAFSVSSAEQWYASSIGTRVICLVSCSGLIGSLT